MPDRSDLQLLFTRIFVSAFLVSLLICGFGDVELWPLTAWRLFSVSRTEAQSAWLATSVGPAGDEEAIRFHEMDFMYHGATHILREFPRLDDPERLAVCQAWRDGITGGKRAVTSIRIYRTERVVSQRVGERGAPPRKDLAFECTARSVRTFPIERP